MSEGRSVRLAVQEFALAFTDGYEFREAEWDYRMEVRAIGELRLPSGRIIAADPGHLDDQLEAHFRQEVPPGTYPVDLAILHSRLPSEEAFLLHGVACLRVRFKSTPAVRWVLATIRNQNVEDLSPFDIFGYGADVGMGAFVDAVALSDVFHEYRSRNESLSDEFYTDRVLPAYEAGGLHASVPLDRTTGANLIVCSSGMGDGFYASYWGYDDEDEPVGLVTDFGLLTRTVRGAREVGTVADLLAGSVELDLPGGSVSLRARRRDPRVPAERRTLIVHASGSGTSSIDVVARLGRLAVNPSTTQYCGDEWEYGFNGPVPDDAVVIVSYVDRIESLMTARRTSVPGALDGTITAHFVEGSIWIAATPEMQQFLDRCVTAVTKAGIRASGTSSFSILVGERQAELRLEDFYPSMDDPTTIDAVVTQAAGLAAPRA